jgi:hypothetical protein
MAWPPFIFLILVGTAVITVLHHYQYQPDRDTTARRDDERNKTNKSNGRKKVMQSQNSCSKTKDNSTDEKLAEHYDENRERDNIIEDHKKKEPSTSAGITASHHVEDLSRAGLLTDQGLRNRLNNRTSHYSRKSDGHEVNLTVDQWRGSPSDDEVEDEKEKRSFQPFESAHIKAAPQEDTSVSPLLEEFSPICKQRPDDANQHQIITTALDVNTHGDWMDSPLLRDSTDTVTYSVYDGTASKKHSLDENQITMFDNPLAANSHITPKEPSILVSYDPESREFNKHLAEYREKSVIVGNAWNQTNDMNPNHGKTIIANELDENPGVTSSNEDKTIIKKQNLAKDILSSEIDDRSVDTTVAVGSLIQKKDITFPQNEKQIYNPVFNSSMNSSSFEFELPSDAPLLTFDAVDNHNHLHHDHHHISLTHDCSSVGNTVPIRAPSLLIPSTSLEKDSEINKRFFSNPFPSSSNSSSGPSPIPNLSVIPVVLPSQYSPVSGDLPSAHSGDEGVNSGGSSVASKTSRTSRSSFHSYSSNKINPFFSTPSPSPSSANGEQQKISRSTMTYIQQLDTFIRNRTDFYAPGYYYNIVLLFDNVKPSKSSRFNHKKIGNVKDFITFLRKLPDYFHVSSDHKSVELVQLTPVSFIFSSNPSFSSLAPSFSGSGSSAEGEEYPQAIRRSGSSASSLRGSFSFGDIKGQALMLLEEDDENSTIATDTLPIFVGDQMTSQISVDQPLFGSFHCVNKYCYKRWNSVCSFPNVPQLCPKCGIKVFPYSQRALELEDRDYNDSEDEGKTPSERKNRKQPLKVASRGLVESKSKDNSRKNSLKDLKNDNKKVSKANLSEKEKSRTVSKSRKGDTALPSELKVGMKPNDLEEDEVEGGEDAIFRKVDSLDSYYEHPHDLEVNSVASSGSSGVASVHSSY